MKRLTSKEEEILGYFWAKGLCLSKRTSRFAGGTQAAL